MASLLPFDQMIIAVTGAASGIGAAVAHYLAARGASLSLADIDGAALASLSSSLMTSFPEIRIIFKVVDVQNLQDVRAWMSETVEELGRLSGAANLAGIVGKSVGKATTSELDKEEWDRVIGVNLTGLFHCLKEELRVIEDGGSIVNAASVAALVGSPMNSSYAASKHGVVGLTRSAAKEFGIREIRINCVCPGPVETPLLMKHGASAVEFSNPPSAIKRNAQPEEIAAMIAYLLGNESRYVSGASLSIDGAWAC